MLPLPVLVVAEGLVPAARLLMLGTITAAVMLFESSRGIIGTLAAFLFGQAIVYLALLWGVAWALARGLARLPPRAAALLTVGGLLVGLVLVLSFEVYLTPFAADAPRGNLIQVYR